MSELSIRGFPCAWVRSIAGRRGKRDAPGTTLPGLFYRGDYAVATRMETASVGSNAFFRTCDLSPLGLGSSPTPTRLLAPNLSKIRLRVHPTNKEEGRQDQTSFGSFPFRLRRSPSRWLLRDDLRRANRADRGQDEENARKVDNRLTRGSTSFLVLSRSHSFTSPLRAVQHAFIYIHLPSPSPGAAVRRSSGFGGLDRLVCQVRVFQYRF